MSEILEAPARSASSVPAPDRAFLGWRVLAAAFIAQFVSNSVSLGSVGMFFTSIESEFGVSTKVLSGVVGGASIFFMSLFSPLVGRWIDRGPHKWIMLGGAALLSVGMLLTSQVTQIWQLALCFCVIVNFGYALMGPLPSITLASRWFVRRRGMAVAITVAGATAASAAAPWAAAQWIAAYGWRTAVVYMGICAALIALPAFALLIVARPEEVSQFPDGDAEAPVEPEMDGEGSLTRQLLRDRNFWVIAIGLGLLFTSPIVCALQVPAFAEEELGIDKLAIAPFFSMLAVFSLVGKILFAVVGDRVHPRISLWLALGLCISAWLILMERPSYQLFVFSGVLFGLGVGAVAPLQAVVIGRCFGREGFGQVMGLSGLVGLPLIAGATPLTGYVALQMGGYGSAFGLEVLFLSIAAICLLALRIPELPVQPGALAEPDGAAG